MFDAPQNGIVYTLRKPVDPGDRLKKTCRSSAELWAIKRRANRPYVAPQRLPVTARGA